MRFIKRMYVCFFLLICNIALAADSDIKNGLGKVMGFIAAIAFVGCVAFLLGAIFHYRQGQDYQKDLISLAVCAAAVTICGALFAAFGLGDAAVKPSF